FWLESSVPMVHDCYAQLCEFTHPAAASTWFMLDSTDGDTFTLLQPDNRKIITGLYERKRPLLLPLLMFAFNPSFLTFKVLTHFSAMPKYHCATVEGWSFDTIAGWRRITQRLGSA